MPYRKPATSTYNQRRPKIPMPKGLKGEARKLYVATAIRPAGEWSRDLLQETDAGKVLAIEHYKHVAEALEKAKPKNKTDAMKVVKKAMMSPQQRFVILYEKSLRMPLDAREFREYLDLFKECFPTVYKNLYGSKAPTQVFAEAFKSQKKRK